MTRETSAVLLAALAVLAAPATGRADVHRLPAGTVVPVKFDTTVSSATSRPEDRVVATVRQDVRSGGTVVIPAGSEVRGHVASARRSGRIKGRAFLSVAFTEIEIAGRTHQLSAQRVSVLAPATHGRDAKIVGGSAAAGAVVGAIAGGKEGLAKGAGVGAVAGTGAVLATRGKEVTLPAGTRWRLRLTKPLVVE